MNSTPVWLTALAVLGTWVIAALALWGEKIKATLFKPDLRLRLLNQVGEFCPQTLRDGHGHVQEAHDARYYHMQVANKAAFPQARDVQVLIIAVDRRGPTGDPQRVYTGALPLGWRHGELHPTARPIGTKTEADADLMWVRQGRLQLTPMVAPNNFPPFFTGETHIWITAVARGIESESNIVRLRIDWDGAWDRGDAEMAKHLVISEIRDDPAGASTARGS